MVQDPGPGCPGDQSQPSDNSHFNALNCVIREWKSRTEESKFFGIEFTVDDKDDKEEIDYVDDEMMVLMMK